MFGNSAYFFLVPAVYALFSLTLAFIAVIDKKLIAARWAALGFFVAGISITMDRFRDLTSMDWISWITIVTHLAALLGMMLAFASRHRPDLPRVTIGVTILGSILVIPGVPWEGAGWMRPMIVQGTGAAIILSGAWTLWDYRKITMIDQLAFIFSVCAGVAYGARASVALFHPGVQSGAEAQEYYEWISMIFHSTSSIMALMVGLLMMMSIGHDMLQGRIKESEIDPLTNLGNRRQLERLIAEDEQADKPIGAVLAIDLDHFKQINDTFGHAAGDEVLRRVGERLTSMFQPFGKVCRTGGEEFVILIDADFAPGAGALALSLRKAIADIAFQGHLAPLTITASIGVHILADDDNVRSAIQIADKALYSAKNEGRDRVVGSAQEHGSQTVKAVA